MVFQHVTRGSIKKIIFIALIVVSGYALAVTGNMSNPFTVFSEINTLVVSGEQSGPADREMLIDGDETAQERPAPPEGDFEGERPDETTIQWDRFGAVLFNAWFIAAAAAVVMLISAPLKTLLKPLRRLTKVHAQPRRANAAT